MTRRKSPAAAPAELLRLRHGLVAVLVLRKRCPMWGSYCGCDAAAQAGCEGETVAATNSFDLNRRNPTTCTHPARPDEETR